MNHHRMAGVVRTLFLAGILLGVPAGLVGRLGQAAQAGGGLTLSARAGFDGYCKKGEWIPIQVAVENAGPDMNARVQVSYREKIYYAADFLLPAASNRRLFLYVYDQNFSRDLSVTLEVGDTLLAQDDLKVTCLSDSNRLVGLLVDDLAAYTQLTDIPLVGGSVRLAQLAPTDLPDQAQGWSGLDLLVVSGVDTGKLSEAQLRALQAWLAGGGKMLVVGGPHWQEAAAAVDAYLPLELNGTRTVPGLSALQVYSEIPLPEDSTAILATGRAQARRCRSSRGAIP